MDLRLTVCWLKTVHCDQKLLDLSLHIFFEILQKKLQNHHQMQLVNHHSQLDFFFEGIILAEAIPFSIDDLQS